DALAGEKCVAVALLKNGFEKSYFTRHAPIHNVVGIGRIVAHEETEDGKFNILLRGEARATIAEEMTGRPYRLARLDLIASYCSAPRSSVYELRRTLREIVAVASWAPPELRDRYIELCDAPIPLGEAVDVIAGCMPIAGELRQDLLIEPDSFARATRLL